MHQRCYQSTLSEMLVSEVVSSSEKLLKMCMWVFVVIVLWIYTVLRIVVWSVRNFEARFSAGCVSVWFQNTSSGISPSLRCS